MRLRIPAAILLAAAPALAAVGCDLNFPNNDVPRLFPGATSFKTTYRTLTRDELGVLTGALGAAFRGLYDPLEVPYTLYEVYTGAAKVGYVHGVNQKGQFGGIQVFVALDLEGRILSFYIQKMSGQWAGKLRDPKFGKQFVGLRRKDFEIFDPVSGKGSGKVAHIHNPAPEMETDFYCVLRALKKNLVLMDIFVYNGKRP